MDVSENRTDGMRRGVARTGAGSGPLRRDWQVTIRGEICGLVACSRQIWRIAKYTLLAVYGDFLDFLAIIRHN